MKNASSWSEWRRSRTEVPERNRKHFSSLFHQFYKTELPGTSVLKVLNPSRLLLALRHYFCIDPFLKTPPANTLLFPWKWKWRPHPSKFKTLRSFQASRLLFFCLYNTPTLSSPILSAIIAHKTAFWVESFEYSLTTRKPFMVNFIFMSGTLSGRIR